MKTNCIESPSDLLGRKSSETETLLRSKRLKNAALKEVICRHFKICMHRLNRSCGLLSNKNYVKFACLILVYVFMYV